VFNAILRGAADWGLTSTVGYLVRHGVYPNQASSHYETALYKAVKNGHLRTVATLLAERANPNIPDRNANFPLHVACAQNNRAMAKLLLDNDALIEALNLKASTPLHAAAYHGSARCIELLLERGANVNAVNINNFTPLQFAAAQGQFRAFKILLQKGADPTVVLNMQRFNRNELLEATSLLKEYTARWREQHRFDPTPPQQTQEQASNDAQDQVQPQEEPQDQEPSNIATQDKAQPLKSVPPVQSRPKFFTGIMPESGQRLFFKETLITPNGNCGFAAFAENFSIGAVSEVRTDVAKTLWRLRNNETDRHSLGEEILTLILDREWFHRTTGSEISTVLRPQLAKEAKEIAALYMMYTLFNQEEVKQVIDDYCQSKRMYSYYVMGLKDFHWLAPTSACLYAREKGVNLFIWRPGRQEGELVLESRQESFNGPPVHLFHKPDFNHFDRLEPVSEPSPEQRPGESTRELPASASAVRAALMRSLKLPSGIQMPVVHESPTSDTSSGWEF
jgi:hypothetical protein